MELDKIDRAILNLLQADAHLTIQEIGQRISLSKTPVHERIKRLEREGVIARYVTVLDKKKIGHPLAVFCQISLDKQTADNFAGFDRAVLDLPEVLSCHLVSGTFDYLIQVIVSDMDAYNQFYRERLSVISGIVHISSFFVMTEVKNTTAIPV